MKVGSVCRLGLPGARARLGFQEEIVYIVCPQPMWEVFVVDESGTAVVHKSCFCPAVSFPRRRRQCLTHSLCHNREVWRVRTHHQRSGKRNIGPGGSGCRSGGAQHFRSTFTIARPFMARFSCFIKRLCWS